MIGLAHNLIQDFRFGLRLIKRSRVVALGVVISLGLGIGATASVFSFLDFFILRPLPVAESDHVVRLRNSTPANSINFSYPESGDYVERSRSFSGTATYEMTLVGLAPKTGDQPRVTLAMLVSGNFFSMLQVKPAAGRGFLPQEDTVPGRDAVAVISHAEWQRDFGAAADVVGHAVAINGHIFTIVGVAPEEFAGIDPVIEPGIYIPRMMMQQADVTLDISNLTNRSVRSINLIARLKPRVTVAQAKADIERISKQLEMEYPETNKDTRAAVFTQLGYRLARTPDNGRMGVLLFGVVFLVMGIACVNVSNLLLSTVPARTREMAVRVAMGAPRMRLLQQGDATVAVLLVETDVSPETLTSAIRTEVRNIAPNVPIFDVRTMQDHYLEYGLFEPRLKAQIFTAIGAVGLVLGVLGLYGVIAYSVEQRTHEIGVRMAVGASDRQVLRMILLQGLRSSGVAAAIGISVALALSGMIQGFVYVNARDPAIYIAVLLLMLTVTGAACYVPARRASMVDPNITLRS